MPLRPGLRHAPPLVAALALLSFSSPGCAGRGLPAAQDATVPTSGLPATLAAEDSQGLRAQLPEALPSVVEFMDQDCPACRAVWPTVVSLTARHQERLRVYLVDVKRSFRLAREYGITFTPTFLAFDPGGKPKDRQLISSPAQLAFLFEKWSSPPASEP